MMDIVQNHSNQNITEPINTSYEVSCYIIFFQILCYVVCFICRPPHPPLMFVLRHQEPIFLLQDQTKFHIHLKQKVKLQALCKF